MDMNIGALIESRFSTDALQFLRGLGEVAHAEGISVFMVGGAVRDVLLGRETTDIDIVVEADANIFAKSVCLHLGRGEVIAHERFGTAKYVDGQLSVDIATSRKEKYPRSGSLPVVSLAAIQEDLGRRDFSINAMAVDLRPGQFGELLDPCGGNGDLESGLIRVLHPNSFADDATRILRSIRYEQRLSFRMDDQTEALVLRDCAKLDTISGDRIRRELERWFLEPAVAGILERADELGLLAGIHNSLAWSPHAKHGLTQAVVQYGELLHPFVILAVFVFPLSLQDSEGLVKRLSMPGSWTDVVSDIHKLKERLPALGVKELPNSEIFRLLEGLNPHAIEGGLFMVLEPVQREKIECFLRTLRDVKLELTGTDIIGMKVPPGPRLGDIIRRLLDAKLDGLAPSRVEEEELVRKWLGL